MQLTDYLFSGEMLRLSCLESIFFAQESSILEQRSCCRTYCHNQQGATVVWNPHRQD